MARYWSDETGVPVNTTPAFDDAVFLSGRALAGDSVIEKASSAPRVAFYDETGLIAIRLSNSTLHDVMTSVGDNPMQLPRELEKVAERKEILSGRYTIAALWDLITMNYTLLQKLDAQGEGRVPNDLRLLGPRSRLKVGEVSFEGPTVIDTRSGPVILEDKVTIGPFSIIRGPAWIGRGSTILSARIESVTIAPNCKVGGEVKHSIIEEYSNKAHEGYIGRSYVGRWVNIGAHTVTSDLKNTYGTIRVSVGGRTIDTTLQKIGVFVADYVKTAIGTLLFAGKKIGTCSLVFDTVIEDVPPFTIYAPLSLRKKLELRLEKAYLIQERVAKRRGCQLKVSEREMLKAVYEMTKRDRFKFGAKPAPLS